MQKTISIFTSYSSVWKYGSISLGAGVGGGGDGVLGGVGGFSAAVFFGASFLATLVTLATVLAVFFIAGSGGGGFGLFVLIGWPGFVNATVNRKTSSSSVSSAVWIY